MNGQDINGWFIGFIESQNNTYFFSTNIQSEQRATGSKASDGALSTRIDSSHKYWSIGALITMLGTFYTGYKGSKEGHKYFAASSLLCMIKKGVLCDT